MICEAIWINIEGDFHNNPRIRIPCVRLVMSTEAEQLLAPGGAMALGMSTIGARSCGHAEPWAGAHSAWTDGAASRRAWPTDSRSSGVGLQVVRFRNGRILFCSVLKFGPVPTSPTPLLQGAPGWLSPPLDQWYGVYYCSPRCGCGCAVIGIYGGVCV